MNRAVKAVLKSLLAARHPVAAAAVTLAREIVLAVDSALSRGSIRELGRRGGARVHLGCGTDVRPGWINVDMLPRWTIGSNRPSGTKLFCYDLRRGLPMDEGSCDVIYSSHFFEHLRREQGLTLMRDCHRALRPGGLFRLCLPDFERTFRAYLEADRKYFALAEDHVPESLPGLKTMADYVNFAVYQNGEHQCVYDRAGTKELLSRLGYSSVELSEFRKDVDVDTSLRREYSFYVDAVK